MKFSIYMTTISLTVAAISLLASCRTAQTGQSGLRDSYSPSPRNDAAVIVSALLDAGVATSEEWRQNDSSIKLAVKDIWCRGVPSGNPTCGVYYENITFDDSVTPKIYPVIARLGTKRAISRHENEYEIKNVECFKSGVATTGYGCRFDIGSTEAAVIYRSLEAAGVQPGSLSGEPSYGETNLTASKVSCNYNYSRNGGSVRKCEFDSDSRKYDVPDPKLTAILSSIVFRMGGKPDELSDDGQISHDLHMIDCSVANSNTVGPKCRIETSR